MSDYPEHDKLAKVRDRSQAIGEFLDIGPYVLAEWDDETERYWPVTKPIATILADYFGIDLDRLEAEKRAMLEAHRAL